ncbi:unnamed protein product, partial [Cyprideis torosa]
MHRLNALGITTTEVFDALEKNNSIAGGGYIEKSNQAYFIRGEGLVKGPSDIEQIVVKTIARKPVYIRDIADVQLGSANRFGAITANGEGEKVLGQIMMLKGANSNEVITNVKKRVAEISESLPPEVWAVNSSPPLTKAEFPEVDQVVTRIGAAEVPTDPMSMEESDVIITLLPKGEWTSASTKDELADKFKQALSIIPNIEIEFTQPIEMRFNELITGVRADVAIKVFGEDLEVLADLGDRIKTLIQDVPGAEDISVDKIDGLPQLLVSYDRNKIATYGLNIADINQVLSMSYAGNTVGQVFEGERRFDIVIRLPEKDRGDIRGLQNLLLDTPSGYKVPLGELATIEQTFGAAKISRDDTHRRMVVGVN